MALDLTLPADNTLGDATPLRANFAAIAQSLYGLNFIPNGDFIIWPTSSLPAHFVVDGTAPTITRDTGTTKRGSASCKLVGGASAGRLRYSAFKTTNFNTGFRGVTVHLGAWLWSAAASSIRLFIDGVGAAGPQYSSYHTGSSAWEYVTYSYTLPNDATALYVGVEVGGTKTGYVWGLGGGLFGAPPQDFIPCPTSRGFFYFPQPGSATTNADYEENNIEFSKPGIVLGSKAFCKTAPVTTSFTWNIAKLTTAPSTYTAMYTADLAMTAGSKRGDASVYAPNSATYTDRCFDGNVTPGSSLVANTVLGKKITAAGGTAAVDTKIVVEVMQYNDILASWKLSGEF